MNDGTPGPTDGLALYHEAQGDSEELPAVLVMGWDDTGERFPLPLTFGASPVDALSAIVQMQRGSGAALVSPDWVIFYADVYVTIGRAIEANLEPGELEARFKLGMGGVEEALAAHMVARDGRIWTARQTYSGPPKRRCWGSVDVYDSADPDPDERTKGIGGRVVELLCELVSLPERICQHCEQGTFTPSWADDGRCWRCLPEEAIPND